MKSPHLQLKEAIYEISINAFEIDDFLKEAEAKIQQTTKIRDHLLTGLDLEISSEQRRELSKAIEDLDVVIERSREELRNYLEDYLRETKVEIEFPDQEKLDAAFEKARVAHERVYVLYKHTRPELVEGFLEIALDAMTPEEVEEFWESVRRRETDELDEILESVEAEKTALKP